MVGCMKLFDTVLSTPIAWQLHERLAVLAKSADRTLAAEARRALRLYVQETEMGVGNGVEGD